MTDNPLRLSDLPGVDISQLGTNPLFVVLTYDPQTQLYENQLLDFNLLINYVENNITHPNSFLGQEWLNHSTNTTLTNSDPSFHYIEPTTDLTFQLPNPQGSDYFRFRSLDGTFVITITDENNQDLIYLGNQVDNQNTGLETKLLGDCHYINSQWICNVF